MGIKETMRKGFEKATKINEERKLTPTHILRTVRNAYH